MPNPHSRYLGDEHSAIVEQALLNMVLRGDIQILRKNVNITESFRSQAERINAAYDAVVPPKPPRFADPMTGRMSQVKPSEMAPPKPSGMPPKSELKPPRVRRRATSSEGKPPYSKGRVS